MIAINDLHKSLGGTPVLRGIDLVIENGEVLALIGPSGTGKSVLLKHIVGLLDPDLGDVYIEDRSVRRASAQELAGMRRSMGYVFQDAALLDSLTVENNLRLALNDAEFRRDNIGALRRIMAAIAAVNLDVAVLAKFPGELSGGMRKRVGVARAIIHEPRILLYDEPSTGLDPRNVAVIDELVLRNRDRFGATSIIVTHDIPSVHRVADRVAVLSEGKVRFLGTPRELNDCDDPHVRNFMYQPRRQNEHV